MADLLNRSDSEIFDMLNSAIEHDRANQFRDMMNAHDANQAKRRADDERDRQVLYCQYENYELRSALIQAIDAGSLNAVKSVLMTLSPDLPPASLASPDQVKSEVNRIMNSRREACVRR